MWIRTLQVLQAGTEQIPANTRLQVDDHIGRILVRRKKAETIIVNPIGPIGSIGFISGDEATEAEMDAVLTPDQTAPPKNVEK